MTHVVYGVLCCDWCGRSPHTGSCDLRHPDRRGARCHCGIPAHGHPGPAPYQAPGCDAYRPIDGKPLVVLTPAEQIIVSLGRIDLTSFASAAITLHAAGWLSDERYFEVVFDLSSHAIKIVDGRWQGVDLIWQGAYVAYALNDAGVHGDPAILERWDSHLP